MAVYRFDKRELSGARGPYYGHRVQVRFQDNDAAGIAFFARLTEYFHDAWFAFLMDHGIDMPRVIREGPLAPLKHAEADFFLPVGFGDRLEAQVVKVHVDGGDLTVGFRLVREKDGAVVAVGQQAHAFVELETFRKTEVPTAFLDAFARLGVEGA